MSAPSGVGAVAQPTHFAFDAESLARAKTIIGRYPAGRQASAVLPLLDLAQRQCGNWLPRAAMDYVAGLLDMAPIRVYEVATFYSMFNLQPVGQWFFQICTTTPCWLRGSDQVVAACERKLGIHVGETSADGKFTLKEVECLGACVNAPIIQVNDDFYEDLDGPSTERLIDELAAGRVPPVGSVIGRQKSAPDGGPQVLKTVPPRYEWTLEAPPAPPPAGSDD
jgi:NADH-quinone oxidoreductase E subunit